MKKFVSPYKVEAELCDAFVEVAAKSGWAAYPECGNWDLLMVRDGIQVGVEAKLRVNLEVVAQALPGLCGGEAPNYSGVLVPMSTGSLVSVCRALKIHVWDHGWIDDGRMRWARPQSMPRFEKRGDLCLVEKWKIDAKPVELPEVAIQTSGGRPSPKVMSKWRVSALRVCMVLENQGYLTRADIIAGGCDPGRWTQYWMVPDGKAPGPKGRMVKRYVPNPRAQGGMPSVGYEAEMAALAAKDAECAAAEGAPEARCV